MGFSALDTAAGVAQLNEFMASRSYITGYTPSQADLSVFAAVAKAPDAKAHPHAARWYSHIANLVADKSVDEKAWSGEKKDASAYGPEGAAPSEAKAAEEDEDDIDLFGSDDEEVDEEAEKIKQERLAAYNAKKSAKPKAAAKSMVIFDVKPWDDETDMEALQNGVSAVQMDGLVWGTKKLVAVGYGIKKLQITCVIEDDKVSTDDLIEQICTDLSDYVQSVDIAAFNKL
ncbi:hypothetical protein CXG81DRAFT_9455 [Caulochytrium protostelioides]|uniref:Elongation factor 1-beta n=1 Tax=Caulochytrium protostelioides TaxID=1555241 RepID=A0A4P9XDD1_9FUNG|nr:hypothetical protein CAUPRSCDRAFT_6300 [Caulochytrium protostelioides]RKP03514.1 hypothetical protein CXG81DRAFT_9455 [Caulochytrium protostelioides]|eukprot:RKP03514.1 hypothetical protein CXG81DRAFT_9455 [Caulochytrium protostelioides]